MSPENGDAGVLVSVLVVHEVNDGGSLVLALEGELDIETGVTNLVLDLSKVSFVDSSGLTSLASALRSAQAAGAALTLRNASRQLRDLFVITSLDTVFVVEA